MNDIFERVEKKYLFDEEKYNFLMDRIAPYLCPAEFPFGKICSLYLDTDNYRLIRASIDAVSYKEKLRIRSYGECGDGDNVFFEIKKKLKGVVYKRREKLNFAALKEYISGGGMPKDTQIMREIDYLMRFYGFPKPKMLITYSRRAFCVKDMPALRITFDRDIFYRTDNLSFSDIENGTRLLPQNAVLMEFKTDGAMPLWLCRALDEAEIYPASFSKYGTAYKKEILGIEPSFAALNNKNSFEQKGEYRYA